MVDNIEIIKPLLVFESNDDFYFLIILCRRKENPELKSNTKVIKSYYIDNINYLEDKYEEIKQLCEVFNARAMINLNKRSYKKVAFKSMENLSRTLSNEDYKPCRKAYDSACGQSSNAGANKVWVLDIDDDFLSESKGEEWLITAIDSCMPVGDKIVTKIPSKSGYHLITKPFNLQSFQMTAPGQYIEIKKQGITNIFIP